MLPFEDLCTYIDMLLLFIEGDQHNSNGITGGEAGIGVSTLRHRQERSYRRARNGRNYSGNAIPFLLFL